MSEQVNRRDDSGDDCCDEISWVSGDTTPHSTNSYDTDDHVYCCAAFYNSDGQLTIIELYLCDDTNMWVVDDITYPEEDYEICQVTLQPYINNIKMLPHDLERLLNNIITRITPIRLHQLIYECPAPKVWVIYDVSVKKTTRYMQLDNMISTETREYDNYQW